MADVRCLEELLKLVQQKGILRHCLLVPLCRGLSITVPAHRQDWKRQERQDIRLGEACQPKGGWLALRQIHGL